MRAPLNLCWADEADYSDWESRNGSGRCLEKTQTEITTTARKIRVVNGYGGNRHSPF